MTGYVPTTGQVREAYIVNKGQWRQSAGRGFDAWLDQVKAAACREGWEACALAIQDGLGAWDAFEHYGRSETEEDRHVDQ